MKCDCDIGLCDIRTLFVMSYYIIRLLTDYGTEESLYFVNCLTFYASQVDGDEKHMDGTR